MSIFSIKFVLSSFIVSRKILRDFKNGIFINIIYELNLKMVLQKYFIYLFYIFYFE